MPRIKRQGQNKTVGGNTSRVGTQAATQCACCLGALRSGKRRGEPRRFCSDRCRRLSWWAAELVQAVDAGHAEGLRAQLERVRIRVIKTIRNERGWSVADRRN